MQILCRKSQVKQQISKAGQTECLNLSNEYKVQDLICNDCRNPLGIRIVPVDDVDTLFGYCFHCALNLGDICALLNLKHLPHTNEILKGFHLEAEQYFYQNITGPKWRQFFKSAILKLKTEKT